MTNLPPDDSLIHDYLDARLSPSERVAFEQRMAASPELRAEVEIYEEIRMLALSTPRPEIPVGLADRISQRVRADLDSAPARRWFVARPPAWAAAAALLILIGVIAWWPPPAKTSDLTERPTADVLLVSAPGAIPGLTKPQSPIAKDSQWVEATEAEDSGLAKQGETEQKPNEHEPTFAGLAGAVPGSGSGASPLDTPTLADADVPSSGGIPELLTLELVGEEDVARFRELCETAGYRSVVSLEFAAVPMGVDQELNKSDEARKLADSKGGDDVFKGARPAHEDKASGAVGGRGVVGGGGGGAKSRSAAPSEKKNGVTSRRAEVSAPGDKRDGLTPRLSGGAAPKENRDAIPSRPAEVPARALPQVRIVDVDLPASVVASLRQSYGPRLAGFGIASLPAMAKKAPTPDAGSSWDGNPPKKDELGRAEAAKSKAVAAPGGMVGGASPSRRGGESLPTGGEAPRRSSVGPETRPSEATIRIRLVISP